MKTWTSSPRMANSSARFQVHWARSTFFGGRDKKTLYGRIQGHVGTCVRLAGSRHFRPEDPGNFPGRQVARDGMGRRRLRHQ
jgi:hypothetical protein